MRHRIKITYDHYEDKLAGLKDWEIRKNDKPYEIGDEVQYILVTSIPLHNPLQQEIYEITNILKEHEGLKTGYIIFSDKLIS